jgi:hypothetical protein
VGFFLPGPLGPTLLRTAQQSSYFFVYDVFITGILKQKLSLNLIHLGRKKVKLVTKLECVRGGKRLCWPDSPETAIQAVSGVARPKGRIWRAQVKLF